MLYNITYKNGSNEIEVFEDLKSFGNWWKKMVRLHNRRRGTVQSVTPIN